MQKIGNVQLASPLCTADISLMYLFRHLPDLHKSLSIAFFSTSPVQNIRSDKSVAARAVVARRNACRSLRKLSVIVVPLHA